MSQENDGQPGLPLPAPRDNQAMILRQGQALSLDLRGPERDEASDEINLLDYWRIIVKRRWTVLTTLGIVLVTTLVATLLMTPVYRASATLQIERDTIKVLDVEGLTPTESPTDRDFYQTQYELLKSRSLAQRVIAELNLADDPTWQAMNAPSPWSALFGGGDEEEEIDAEALALKEDAATSRRINAFLKRLSIEPVRNSRLVRVHFDSPDPVFSQRVVNAVAQAYIAANLERRYDASSYAKTFLEDRLEQMKLRLEDSEKELVAFAQRERIVQSGDANTLSNQALSELSAALTEAKDQRIRAEARWRQAESATGMGLTAVLESSLIQTLQESRAKLQAEYQDKLRIYKPAFPAMQQLKAQIEELDRQIAAEVANIKASIRAEYQAALAQEQLLAEQLDSAKEEALDLQNRSIQYNILRREVDTNRQQYEALLQRYKEVGLAGGVGTNNISIVDRAEVPTGRHRPRLVLNLAIGLLLGLFGGVLLALVFEHLDDTVKSPEDMEKQMGLPVLGVIPRLKAPMTPAKALADPRSAFAEAYRSVRTALQFSTEEGVPRCLLVTSPSPAEGKTTTVLTLAQNFAQLGKRVLVIDADLRNPSLHKVMGLDNGAGLSNFLSGAAKATEVIRETGTGNLWVMTTGPLPPNPAELLLGPKMVSLLKVAADRYDQVLIDGPPVMGLADAPILGNLANGTLVVFEAGGTRMGVARHALKRLLAARARVIGGILTKFDSKAAGYGYAYGGHDYYSYGTPQPPSRRLARR